MANVKLLISGKMGSGKGYAAAHFEKEYGASLWSRTEMMKILAHAIVDRIGNPDDVLNVLFPDPDERDEVRRDLLSYARHYRQELGKPRRLYQDITSICQDKEPLCFEVELHNRMKKAGKQPFMIVDDVRSREAFDYFSGEGFRTLRIEADETIRKKRIRERDGYLPDEETFNHISETALDHVPHEFTVENNGDDLNLFYSELKNVVDRLHNGRSNR